MVLGSLAGLGDGVAAGSGDGERPPKGLLCRRLQMDGSPPSIRGPAGRGGSCRLIGRRLRWPPNLSTKINHTMHRHRNFLSFVRFCSSVAIMHARAHTRAHTRTIVCRNTSTRQQYLSSLLKVLLQLLLLQSVQLSREFII